MLKRKKIYNMKGQKKMTKETKKRLLEGDPVNNRRSLKHVKLNLEEIDDTKVLECTTQKNIKAVSKKLTKILTKNVSKGTIAVKKKHAAGTAGRASIADTQVRIHTICNLIADGYTSADVKDYVHNNTTWNIQNGTILKYINKSMTIIERNFQLNLNRKLILNHLRLDRIYKNCNKEKEYKTSLDAIKESNALFGLYPKAPKDNNNEIETVDFEFTEIKG